MVEEPVEQMSTAPTSDSGSPLIEKLAPRLTARKWLEWLVEHGVAALGLAGLMLYVVVRFGVQGFYGYFQVSPESVGLSQSLIIAQAALSLILFVAISVGAIVVLIVVKGFALGLVRQIAFGVNGRGSHESAAHRRTQIVWSAFVLIAFIPVTVNLLSPGLSTFLQQGDIVTVYTAIVWVTLLLLTSQQAARDGYPDDEEKAASCTAARAVAAGDIAVVTALLTMAAATFGRDHFATRVALPVVGVFAALTVLSMWYSVRGTRRTTPGSGDRNWVKFRLFSAARVALIAGSAVWVICRPKNLSAWMPKFETLDNQEIGSSLWDLKMAIGCLAAFAAVVWLLDFFGHRAVNAEAAAPQPRSEREARSLVAGMLIVVALLFVLSYERGQWLASGAAGGDRLRQRGSLLDVSAEPVCLIGSNVPYGYAGPYMLLGSAGGQMVLVKPSNSKRTDFEPGLTLTVGASPLVYISHDVFVDPEGTRIDDEAFCQAARDQTTPPTTARDATPP